MRHSAPFPGLLADCCASLQANTVAILIIQFIRGFFYFFHSLLRTDLTIKASPKDEINFEKENQCDVIMLKK